MKPVLLIALIAASSLYAISPSIMLVVDTKIPLIVEGKSVGTMTLKAGTAVTIIKVEPDGVMIAKGDMTPVKVPRISVTPESLAVAMATLATPKVVASADSVTLKNGTDVSNHLPNKAGVIIDRGQCDTSKIASSAATQSNQQAANGVCSQIAVSPGTPSDGLNFNQNISLKDLLPEKHSLTELQKYADLGNAVAQRQLGFCYANGTGVNADDGKAVTWFKLASVQGDADAQFALGWRFEHGQTVEKNREEAIKWYRKAAERGNVDAKRNLVQLGQTDPFSSGLGNSDQSGTQEGMVMTPVFCDDAENPRENSGLPEVKNLNSTSLVKRGFVSSHILFRYQGLDPKADYQAEIYSPGGLTFDERNLQCPVARPMSVLVGSQKLGVLNPSDHNDDRKVFVIPKDEYRSGNLEIWIKAEGKMFRADSVVGKVTLLSSNAKNKISAPFVEAARNVRVDFDPLESAFWKRSALPKHPWHSLGKRTNQAGVEEEFYADNEINVSGRPPVYTHLWTVNNIPAKVEVIFAEQSFFNKEKFTGVVKINTEMTVEKAWESEKNAAAYFLQTNLGAVYGESKPVMMRWGNRCINENQYTNAEICVRSLSNFDISRINIEPISRESDPSSLNTYCQITRDNLVSHLKSTTATNSDGDIFINIPAAQQIGPYCMVGTATMIANHYGCRFSTFDLAGFTGYELIPTINSYEKNSKERLDVYQDLATSLRSRLVRGGREILIESKIQQLISRGIPIIVWRAFSDKRRDFHLSANKQPLSLPVVTYGKEREKWLTLDSPGASAHASIISGVNHLRHEVLLSESWGKDTINTERVSVPEILFSAYQFDWWEP